MVSDPSKFGMQRKGSVSDPPAKLDKIIAAKETVTCSVRVPSKVPSPSCSSDTANSEIPAITITFRIAALSMEFSEARWRNGLRTKRRTWGRAVKAFLDASLPPVLPCEPRRAEVLPQKTSHRYVLPPPSSALFLSKEVTPDQGSPALPSSPAQTVRTVRCRRLCPASQSPSRCRRAAEHCSRLDWKLRSPFAGRCLFVVPHEWMRADDSAPTTSRRDLPPAPFPRSATEGTLHRRSVASPSSLEQIRRTGLWTQSCSASRFPFQCQWVAELPAAFRKDLRLPAAASSCRCHAPPDGPVPGESSPAACRVLDRTARRGSAQAGQYAWLPLLDTRSPRARWRHDASSAPLKTDHGRGQVDDGVSLDAQSKEQSEILRGAVLAEEVEPRARQRADRRIAFEEQERLPSPLRVLLPPDADAALPHGLLRSNDQGLAEPVDLEERTVAPVASNGKRHGKLGGQGLLEVVRDDDEPLGQLPRESSGRVEDLEAAHFRGSEVLLHSPGNLDVSAVGRNDVIPAIPMARPDRLMGAALILEVDVKLVPVNVLDPLARVVEGVQVGETLAALAEDRFHAGHVPVNALLQLLHLLEERGDQAVERNPFLAHEASTEVGVEVTDFLAQRKHIHLQHFGHRGQERVVVERIGSHEALVGKSGLVLEGEGAGELRGQQKLLSNGTSNANGCVPKLRVADVDDVGSLPVPRLLQLIESGTAAQGTVPQQRRASLGHAGDQLGFPHVLGQGVRNELGLVRANAVRL
eukprot:scaffold7932_cov410-Pinguiococcus_pyrenoidosus.AAC.4